MLGTIAIPRGHFTAPWPFVESLVRYLELHPDVRVIFREGALIEENRNSLASMFWGDWIFFIDDDMVFKPEDIEAIISHDEDIVCGLYFRGQVPHEPMAFIENKPIKNYISGLIIEVDGCAMGFTKISRKAIEAVGLNGFSRLPNLGEDLSFCQRAKLKGFKIYCDTSVQPKHLRYKYIGENDSILI